MPVSVLIPRINNNDDTVRLSVLMVARGAAVKTGDPLAEVETDKANFSVEAEQDGFVLRVEYEVGATCDVGSVLMWVGGSIDEQIEQIEEAKSATAAAGATVKSLLLLARYGLNQSAVPSSGERLTAEDVEAYVRSRGLQPKGAVTVHAAAPAEPKPEEPGRRESMSPQHRAMAKTVTWQRDHAATGYIEVPFDPAAWEQDAKQFRAKHSLMMDPLLSLMAWKLAQLAVQYPKLNATADGGDLYFFDQVNAGFTVQNGDVLMMPVVRNAGGMTSEAFVSALGKLQRQAMKNALKPSEAAGATIAFTSMARWNVSRHVPLLPPHCAFILAHSSAQLGATYDHRVLTGFDVVQALREMTKPT